MAAVALVAFVARAQLAMHHAGVRGLHGYDDGVYYAGAAALVSGRTPYSDFVFMHPPGILLALSPFAWLGSVTSDPLGLASARVAFWLIGALNAALVARVAARHGRLSAVVGGLGYALWFPAVYAERTTLLEPLGNTALLVALLLLGRTRRAPSSTEQLVAGAVVGLAVCVKLWMLAPLAVLVLWQLVAHGWRTAARVAGGAVLAVAIVVLPFAAHARAMVQMVVLEQLGRVSELSMAHRATGIAGLRPWATLLGDASTVGVLAVVGCAGLAAAVAAWRSGGVARWYLALLVVDVVVLLVVAPHFDHYPSFAAVPWALVVAVAMGRLGRATGLHRTWVPVASAAMLFVGLAALYAPALTMEVGRPFPGRELAAAVRNQPCVVSDVPMALVAMDVLTRDLGRGCPAVVDFAAPVYGSYDMRGAGDRPLPRFANTKWQHYLSTYLPSGSAMVVLEPDVTGINPDTMSRLTRRPLLAERTGYQVRQGTRAVLSERRAPRP